MDDLGREAVVEIGDAEQLLASGRAVVTVTPDVCPEVGEPLEEGDIVICRSSQYYLHLVRPPHMMFFDVLRQKLKWGER